jgi:hypothetical protein
MALLRRLGYTQLLPWVAAVARDHGVAAVAVTWDPAGYRARRVLPWAATASRDPTAEVRIPGLPPLQFRDLPSFLTVTSDDDPFACVIAEFHELIDAVERDGDSGKPPRPRGRTRRRRDKAFQGELHTYRDAATGKTRVVTGTRMPSCGGRRT